MADTKDTKKTEATEFVAILQVRGQNEVRKDIKDTLKMLGLSRKNALVIRKKTPSIYGMVQKVKDYVTFGVVSEAVVKEYGVDTITNLHPPRGGFERKGIKAPFSLGGALGNRGDKMADLIKRMHK